MTDEEKKALILAGIPTRSEHYLQVKSLPDLPLQTVSNRTGFTVHFIKQCREIAGCERRKKEQTMGRWYFTCGQIHSHSLGGGKTWNKDSVIVVEAANEQDAVAFVFNKFGRKWSGVYADFDNIEKYYKNGVAKTYSIK